VTSRSISAKVRPVKMAAFAQGWRLDMFARVDLDLADIIASFLEMIATPVLVKILENVDLLKAEDISVTVYLVRNLIFYFLLTCCLRSPY